MTEHQPLLILPAEKERVYQSFIIPSLPLTQEVRKFDPTDTVWVRVLDCQEMIDTYYGERCALVKSTIGYRSIMALFLAEKERRIEIIEDVIQQYMWKILTLLASFLQAGHRFPNPTDGKPLRLPVESTLSWLQKHIAAYEEAFIEDRLQAEFEIKKAYVILYGEQGIPPIYGRIARIASVLEEDWNNIIDVSSSVQELLNASEEARPGNEWGKYMTRFPIPPRRAVAAVLLRCHIGYSTAIAATDSEQYRFCQQVVWQTLTKECAYLLKSDIRTELAKWLHAHVKRHEEDTQLAERRARANT